ncbi:MAG: hypothetical protein ACOX7Q_09255 [Kiritimatiellia bacterium]
MIRRLTALREKTNPIRLLEDIRRRYALILRKQNKLAKREAQGMTTPGSAPCPAGIPAGQGAEPGHPSRR